MQWIKWLIVGCMISVASMVVYAATVTNHGVVYTTRTFDEMVAAVKNTKVIDDYSLYARQMGRKGTIVRTYVYDLHSTGTLGSAISLEPNNSVQVPSNAVIWDGFVQVVTPVLPQTCKYTLGINSSNDVMAVTTNFWQAGKYAITPVGTVATALEVTNNNTFKVSFYTDAPTQGMFMVFMDYWLAQ